MSRAPWTAAGRLGLLVAVLWTGGSVNGPRRPALSPERARSLAKRVDSLRKNGDPRGALAAVRSLLRAFPDNHRYLYWESEILRDMRGFRHEAAALELYMESAPFPTDACPRLGRAYEAQGLADKGFDAHRRCLEFDPAKADLQLFYALALERRGDAKEAEAAFRRTLALAPDYADAKIGLARVYAGTGRSQEADILIAEALKTGAGNPDVWYAWALSADRVGDRRLARKRLEHAIALSPRYIELYQVLARWCGQGGDHTCAEKASGKLAALEAGQ